MRDLGAARAAQAPQPEPGSAVAAPAEANEKLIRSGPDDRTWAWEPGPTRSRLEPRHPAMVGGLPVVALLLVAVWAESTATRIELLLLDMDCSLCVQGLEQGRRRLPGAEKLRLDLKRRELSLRVQAGSTVADETLRTLLRNAGLGMGEIQRSPITP